MEYLLLLLLSWTYYICAQVPLPPSDDTPCLKDGSCKKHLERINLIRKTVEKNINDACLHNTDKKTLDHLIFKYDLEDSTCKHFRIVYGDKVIVIDKMLYLTKFVPYKDVYAYALETSAAMSFFDLRESTREESHGTFYNNNVVTPSNLTYYGVWGQSHLREFQESLQTYMEHAYCITWRGEYLTIPENIKIGCKNISICSDKTCLSLPPFIMAISSIAKAVTVSHSEYKQLQILSNIQERPICTAGKASYPVCHASTAPLNFNVPTRCEKSQTKTPNKCKNEVERIIKLYNLAKESYENTTMESYPGCAMFFGQEGNDVALSYDFSGLRITDDSDLREQDKKWKRAQSKMWLSECMHQFPNGIDTNQMTMPSTSDSQSEQVNTQTSLPSTSSSSNQFDETGVEEDNDIVTYNEPPPRFAPCRVAITEICPENSVGSSFIELGRFCPFKHERSRATYLSGYYVIIIEAGDQPHIIFFADLSGRSLIEEQVERRQKGYRKGSFFTIGTGESNMKLTEEAVQISLPTGQPISIPRSNQKPLAVVLLYLSEEGLQLREMLNLLKLQNIAGVQIPKAITQEIIEVLETHIQDFIPYGKVCDDVDCWLFSKFIPAANQHDQFLPLAQPSEDINGGFPFQSISYCRNAGRPSPMDMQFFQISPATPNKRNICVQKQDAPFNLRRRHLQSTAQKIIVNAHAFFTQARFQPEMCEGDAIDTSSKALGIPNIAVHQTLSRWEKDEIKTPKRKPNRDHLTIFASLDDYDLDLIRRTIQDFYSRGVPPYLGTIMAAIKERFRNDIGNPGREFKCSLNTFRKILRRMGFRYGRLNERAVIMQKQEFVQWRASYLAKIRANDALPSPLPVVYTDETWIDPHNRQLHAWYMVTDDPRVMKLYMYQHHKIGRGGRIIIVHAGTKDGFIHEAMDVYDVKQSKAAADYHDNMDGKRYIEWFKKLLAALKTPHIIVIDNASIHGVTDAPKSNSLKQEMFDWLVDNIEANQRHVIQKPYNKIRRYELWDIIKNMKKSNNYNIIDKLAAQQGHKLLRLPPYGCELNAIEEVWSDVKRNVKVANVDQNIHTVMELAKQTMLNYPPELWAKHVGHIKKIEQKYWEDDGLYDEFFEETGSRVVIPVQDDDDTEDESDDES